MGHATASFIRLSCVAKTSFRKVGRPHDRQRLHLKPMLAPITAGLLNLLLGPAPVVALDLPLNLAPGRGGMCNQIGHMTELSIAQAFYQRNWFVAFCVVTFLILLWAVNQFRVRHLRRRFELTLEVRVAERTRIVRELHDTLLQRFQAVLLRLQTVAQLIPGRPMDAKEMLDGAIEQAADATNEARESLQGLHASTGNLVLAISTLAEELATDSPDHRSAAFLVTVEGQPCNLPPILRDDIYKIAAEALRNAFRHAQAGQVEVEIRYDNEQFRLRVRDDGRGIDPAVLAGKNSGKHHGLFGMRERAALLRGKLVVWSEVGAGTEVELCVPANVAFAAARRGSWLARKSDGI